MCSPRFLVCKKVHERLGDVLGEMYIFREEEGGESAKFDVKCRNFELMTKKVIRNFGG